MKRDASGDETADGDYGGRNVVFARLRALASWVLVPAAAGTVANLTINVLFALEEPDAEFASWKTGIVAVFVVAIAIVKLVMDHRE